MSYKYKAIKVNGKKIDEHRHVMQVHLGRKLDRNERVRHRDGDVRNNVIGNLYIVTPQEQWNDQVAKGQVSDSVKKGLERKANEIKLNRRPKNWQPKPLGRPKNDTSLKKTITSSIISVSTPAKKKEEKIFETKKADTSKLVSLKIDKRTTIYIKEGTPQKEIDRLIEKYKTKST